MNGKSFCNSGISCKGGKLNREELYLTFWPGRKGLVRDKVFIDRRGKSSFYGIEARIFKKVLRKMLSGEIKKKSRGNFSL